MVTLGMCLVSAPEGEEGVGGSVISWGSTDDAMSSGEMSMPPRASSLPSIFVGALYPFFRSSAVSAWA